MFIQPKKRQQYYKDRRIWAFQWQCPCFYSLRNIESIKTKNTVWRRSRSGFVWREPFSPSLSFSFSLSFSRSSSHAHVQGQLLVELVRVFRCRVDWQHWWLTCCLGLKESIYPSKHLYNVRLSVLAVCERLHPLSLFLLPLSVSTFCLSAICLSAFCLSASLSVWRPVRLPACLQYLSVCELVCLSACYFN